MTSGTAGYYGSTTAGEMRELCHTREFYGDYAPKWGFSCLPELLHRRGYTSVAVHAFTGGMFERKFWYPRLGFDKMVFGQKILRQTHRMCGSAFTRRLRRRHGAGDRRPSRANWRRPTSRASSIGSPSTPTFRSRPATP